MITTELLNGVARHIEGRVAKVVINGSYTITDFVVKSVTNNVLALNYIVPVADVSLVTLIELKDATNKVLSSDSVNVPIGADHMMIQTFTVKEAT